jgi:hypothetical protein
MNTGTRLWTSSEDASMKSWPKPSAQMAAGRARNVCGGDKCDVVLVRGGLKIFAHAGDAA